MKWIPRRLRDVLRKVWEESAPVDPERRTYVMEAEWYGRTDRYFPGDITEKMMNRDDPEFHAPTRAPDDPWRPRRTLG